MWGKLASRAGVSHLNAGGVDEGASAVNGEVGGRMPGYGIWDTDMGWYDLR